MSIEPNEIEEQEPGGDGSPGSGGSADPADGAEISVLERLKQKRESIGAKKFHDMDIPGYDGELVARFKRMRWEALKDIAEQAEQSQAKRKELNGHADVIATACEELFIKKVLPGGEEELTPLRELYPEEFGAVPVRFDPRLSTFLDLKIDGAPTARKVVFAVFNNDLAVTALHNDLGAWMQSSKNEEDSTF
jgi:hypothetical protein